MPTAVQRHARKTRGFEARVAHATALLREAAEDHAGRIVQATSLGVEGMVLTDLIARHGLPIEVATLDTGKLHRETLALIPRLRQRYGATHVIVFRDAHRGDRAGLAEVARTPHYRLLAIPAMD